MKRYLLLILFFLFATYNLFAQQVDYSWKYWQNKNNYATLGQGQYENKLFTLSDTLGQTWTGYQINEVKYVVKSSGDSVYNAQYFPSTGDVIWNDTSHIYRWNRKEIKILPGTIHLSKSTTGWRGDLTFSDYLITEAANGNILVNSSSTYFIESTGIFQVDDYVLILNDTINIKNYYGFSWGRNEIIYPGILSDKSNYWVSLKANNICESNDTNTIQCLQLPPHHPCNNCKVKVNEIAMALDSNGNIWLSTISPYLDRYDGAHWQSFLLPDSNTLINYITVDSKNNILLATSSGLVYYNNYNFISYYPDSSYFTKAYLTYVAVAGDGSIGVVDDSGNVADFLAPAPIDTNSVLHVYPNPFKDEVEFSLPVSFKSGGTLEIFNVTGERVYTVNINPYNNGFDNIKIDASMFSSGVYFCRAINGNKVFMNKIVKQ